jgi:serine/threonine protein kinase
MSEWPTSNDYTVAIQSPHVCFKDPDLRNCHPELHALTRMPKVWTGNFAQVYELRNSTRRWAVKCFTRSSSDVRRRYSIISETVTSNKLPYFIDFRFADEEILVSGKRYPIVKMEWIEGQSLDKFIEANLYKPQMLLGLASRLTEMVSTLETKGIAHGDIQHGNILLKNGELKLVDYDGMFVPQFKGTFAPEQGLPSYQHPQRNAQYYDSTLDRFPLLVICTGLCALAVDPSLWYEFSTGDNLLFTKNDFEHPDTSRLFNRLKNSADSQVKLFTELLRVASKNKPTDVSFPGVSISTPDSVSKPWWVNPTPISAIPSQSSPRTISHDSMFSIRSEVGNHRSIITSISFIIGFLFLYGMGILSLPTLPWLSFLTFTGYLIERWKSFKNLPVFNRREVLSKRLRELEMEIRQRLADQNKLQPEPARLTQQEIKEKASALKERQEKAIIDSLARIDISRLGTVNGIGPYIIGNLRAAGILTAADLRGSRLYSVRGIGSKRSQQIRDMLFLWEKTAGQNIPGNLPYEVEMLITTKYTQQRQGVINHLNSIGQRISALRTECSQRQSEFNQLYIPSFGEYLKHNI